MAVRAWPSTLAVPQIDRRTVIAALLAAIAAALVLVVTQPPDRTPVLVAGSDLPTGAALADLDLEVRYVEIADGLVWGTEPGELAGWSLRIPIAEGEPLVASALLPPQQVAAPNLIALSLDLEHAVLGQIGPGDSVDVYSTVSDGFESTAQATTRIARDVYVVSVDVGTDPSRRGRVDVLLAVDDDLAPVLAGAARSGSVDLVKVTP